MEPPTTAEAIVSFSQSEKIKSGLIWAAQSLEHLAGLEPMETRGAERMITLLIDMVAGETILARRLGNDERWTLAHKSIDKARVMLVSGVPAEAPYHLTQALQQVTAIGQRAMEVLRGEKLI